VIFLGFIVSYKGIHVDEHSASEVTSFQCLTSFYIRFVKEFSILVALFNEIVKIKFGFKWEEKQAQAFEILF
jgi:hypothetical protein